MMENLDLNSLNNQELTELLASLETMDDYLKEMEKSNENK